MRKRYNFGTDINDNKTTFNDVPDKMLGLECGSGRQGVAHPVAGRKYVLHRKIQNQHGTQSLDDSEVEWRCVNGIRLLTVLWILNCFEQIERGELQQACLDFYSRLFGEMNPRQITEKVYETHLSEDHIVLFVDCLNVQLEVWECSCSGDLNTRPVKVPTLTAEENLPGRPHLPFVKFNHGNFFYPLYICQK
ncbi:unnamed protein product [Gongylonema pulchrum]|uniref:Uncharacterized protein n=1 Tax=Gongylonema pulchrum TaxID=637853 RepID=A0A183CY59_9BILA|nr:unnamed protein product [Gongylonema pulchrum]